jgi:hypothetical protein
VTLNYLNIYTKHCYNKQLISAFMKKNERSANCYNFVLIITYFVMKIKSKYSGGMGLYLACNYNEKTS